MGRGSILHGKGLAVRLGKAIAAAIATHAAIPNAHHAPVRLLHWGGHWDAVGNYLLCGETFGEPDINASQFPSQHPVIADGILDTLLFRHQSTLAVNNATIKVYVNGVEQAALIADQVETDLFTALGIAVVAGDYVDVQWFAGTGNPNDSSVIAEVS